MLAARARFVHVRIGRPAGGRYWPIQSRQALGSMKAADPVIDAAELAPRG
jgi:hypothetical protein